MGLTDRITEFLYGNRRIADIERGMELARYKNMMSNLFRYLVNEEKKEQYRADIYGMSDDYKEISKDIEICEYLIRKSEAYSSKEEFIEDNRKHVEYLFGKYQHLIYPEGR